MIGYYFVDERPASNAIVETEVGTFIFLPYTYYNQNGTLILMPVGMSSCCRKDLLEAIGQDMYPIVEVTPETKDFLHKMANGEFAREKKILVVFKCRPTTLDAVTVMNALEESEYYELRYGNMLGYLLDSFTIIGENDGEIIILALARDDIMSVPNDENVLEIKTSKSVIEVHLKCVISVHRWIYMNADV